MLATFEYPGTVVLRENSRFKATAMPGIKSCLQSASRIPLPEPTPPPESGNKEATLIGSWHRFGTTHEGVSAVMPGASCFSDDCEFCSISQRWPAWDRLEGVPKKLK